MTVSMRKMSAGKGYKYLLRSVVAGDGNRSLSNPLTRYYAEAGTPPGLWMGSGVARVRRRRDHARATTVTDAAAPAADRRRGATRSPASSSGGRSRSSPPSRSASPSASAEPRTRT